VPWSRTTPGTPLAEVGTVPVGDGAGRGPPPALAATNCGAIVVNAEQSFTPVHFSGATGARNRVFAVSPPYGTALNTLIPSCATPLIFPAVVVATGAPSAHAQAFVRSASAAAAIPELRSKVRRFM
jgi:hypothetical protein